ncbi:hypothetical protein Fmac_019351 [Flemingia macrophylla]|uniref:MYB transcription factor n=1 Tax=Flemingia macrophylla TaxID=520843 RepID=A0ABD1M7J3_9FABA
MVRAPRCDQNGLKKGAWTPEEDSKLIAYITKYGHWNWRLLPKFAGLARCGKSCRLRWLNYLRPDVKRGNFSRDEEETIVRLHEKLGNRWSAIAAELPGRTDNEIKNHWHTVLKKRFQQKSESKCESAKDKYSKSMETVLENSTDEPYICQPSPQQPSFSGSSCITTDTAAATNHENWVPEIDNDFWTEPYLIDNSYVPPECELDPMLDVELWSQNDLYRGVKRISSAHLGLLIAVSLVVVPAKSLPELVLQVLNKLSNVGALAVLFFHWAEKQIEFKHTIETFHALIEALGKIRQFKVIWTLVNDMNSRKLLSSHTFALIAWRYAVAGKTKEAVKTFEKMERYGLKPHMSDFNRVEVCATPRLTIWEGREGGGVTQGGAVDTRLAEARRVDARLKGEPFRGKSPRRSQEKSRRIQIKLVLQSRYGGSENLALGMSLHVG